MTVVTSDSDAQQQQTQVHSTFEWKTLIETFNDNTNSNKYIELVQSILRWLVLSKMLSFVLNIVVGFFLGTIFSYEPMSIANSFSIHL